MEQPRSRFLRNSAAVADELVVSRSLRCGDDRNGLVDLETPPPASAATTATLGNRGAPAHSRIASREGACAGGKGSGRTRKADRGAAKSGNRTPARRSPTGQPAEERVSGQYEPRDPNSHERHPGNDRVGAGY